MQGHKYSSLLESAKAAWLHLGVTTNTIMTATSKTQLQLIYVPSILVWWNGWNNGSNRKSYGIIVSNSQVLLLSSGGSWKNSQGGQFFG